MNKQCYSKPKVEDKIFGATFQNNLGSIEHMYGNLEDGKLISLYRTVRAAFNKTTYKKLLALYFFHCSPVHKKRLRLPEQN